MKKTDQETNDGKQQGSIKKQSEIIKDGKSKSINLYNNNWMVESCQLKENTFRYGLKMQKYDSNKRYT